MICMKCENEFDPETQTINCPHVKHGLFAHVTDPVSISSAELKAMLFGQLTERGIRSLELIADALQTLSKVESEKFRRQYPEKEKIAWQVNRASDEQRKEFSDKPTDEWIAQTEAALPSSRFQERFNQEAASNPAPPKKQ